MAVMRTSGLRSISFMTMHLAWIAASETICEEGSCQKNRTISSGSLFVQRVVQASQQQPNIDESDGSVATEEDSNASVDFSQRSVSGQISIVSYNLYWWNVRQNNKWGQLWGRIRSNRPFDLIGFQECSNVAEVLQNSGLQSFRSYQGPTPNPAPLAWNPAVFDQLSSYGNRRVGSDQWGARHMTWVRLRHKATGAKIFFTNTHGPLNQCNDALGNAWKSGINQNKQSGDIVFMTGDFNCWRGTAAMNILQGQLSKSVDGGIDFILTDRGSVISGGKQEGSPSDHPLIKGTFRLSGGSTGETTRRRRTPVAQQFRSGTTNCATFNTWPNIDKGVTCGACAALVRTNPYGGRCDSYCASFGHVCVSAAEEQNNDCGIKSRVGCNQAIRDTSDMLCACKRQTVAEQRRRRTNRPSGSTCVDSNVERRRRASSCACRRRNGKSSTGLYECVGGSLNFF